MHLVFLPRAIDVARFFLWSEARAPASGNGSAPSALTALAERGTAAEATVVTAKRARARRPGVAIPVPLALPVLATLVLDDLGDMPPSVAAWSLAAKLALDLIARERITPLIENSATGATARWGISLALDDDAERFTRLARGFPPAAHAIPLDGGSRAQVWTAEDLLLEFLDTVASLLARADDASPTRRAPARRWEERLTAAL